MYRKIIISVFVCLALLLVSNCGRRKNVGEHLMSFRFLFEQWTDTLSNDPAYVCAQVDSLLVHVKDSVVYYQCNQPVLLESWGFRGKGVDVVCGCRQHERKPLCA